jgi:hypothetical protein
MARVRGKNRISNRTRLRQLSLIQVLQASAQLRKWESTHLPWFQTESERAFLLRLIALDETPVTLSEVERRSSSRILILVKRLRKLGLVTIQLKGQDGPAVYPSAKFRRLARRYAATLVGLFYVDT